MSYSATRLTCFAIISALEEDLRAEIDSYVPLIDAVAVLGEDRAARVRARRNKDHGGHDTSLAALLPYVDFQDSIDIILKYRPELPTSLSGSLTRVSGIVARASAVRNRVAHTRPMEIDDLPFLLDLATSLTSESGEHWVNLRNTLERLNNDPAFVLGLTISLPTDPDRSPQNNLPVPDFDETGFFGRQQELARIMKAIRGAYPVVSILGDGGVGKTSIALKAVYELLDDPKRQFDAFVWVTAKATVLTTSEIQRINNTIQDSLGLFAAAAAELGPASDGDPVAEVLSYLEHFRVLLVLDNLETVLDERLRSFLLDLPLGSKVIVTSRIGLGIENPVHLEPMCDDEAAKLLRALARIRRVTALEALPQDVILELVHSMNGHPAYIKWFVAGVQAGKRPEELLANNELLLDFCMSNVYEYLDEDARAVLRCMQVLHGARNQAELAYLNNYPAARIQATLLQLITTNFVQMQSRAEGRLVETTYELTDFARQYLNKQHPVRDKERSWLLARHEGLFALGADLRAERGTDPFNPATVDVRGAGDFHVARLLRDAVLAAGQGNTEQALKTCREAQLLAPTYHEAWRVEAHVHEARADYGAAVSAYERALDLSPSSETLNYFFGFLLTNTYSDYSGGLARLQVAAKREAPSPVVVSEIAWNHLLQGHWLDAISSAGHSIGVRPFNFQEASRATIIASRAGVHGNRAMRTSGALDAGVEILEAAVELLEGAPIEVIEGETLDRVLQMKSDASEIAQDAAEEFLAKKASTFAARLTEVVRRYDPSLIERQLGWVKFINREKFWGFVSTQSGDYFFHYRDLADWSDWERIGEGSEVAFMPNPTDPRGPRAARARLVE
ncbi:MAG TPA: NB-ARC domain-containing protein [Kineosporiaceae bacterium]|nr:NB-ARC domain-containing protein [Kineosporiaceae bacterium]